MRANLIFTEEGINAYPYKFSRTHQAAQLQKIYENLAPGTETEDVVRFAGA